VAEDRSQQRGRRREIALDDPEKPEGETASSDFPAHEVAHGSQVGELLERLINNLPEKLRQPLNFYRRWKKCLPSTWLRHWDERSGCAVASVSSKTNLREKRPAA